MRKFHLSDVLSVITGKLLSNRDMDGIYDILEYMADDYVLSHQIPVVISECALAVVEQYPLLGKIVLPEEADFRSWVDEQIQVFGKELEIEKLPKVYY